MHLLNILGQGQRRAVLLTAIGSDSKSDLLPPQLFEKIHCNRARTGTFWLMALGHLTIAMPYLLNILGQGQRRAVLLTAIGSDSKSDLLPPQLFEKIHCNCARTGTSWLMALGHLTIAMPLFLCETLYSSGIERRLVLLYAKRGFLSIADCRLQIANCRPARYN